MNTLRKVILCALLSGCAAAGGAPGGRPSPLHGLSDDPRQLHQEMLGRQSARAKAAPRFRGGGPDLSGVWLIQYSDRSPEPVAKPWAEEIARKRRRDGMRDKPTVACLPGEPWYPVGNASPLVKFVHKPNLLVILFESVPGYRQIFLNGDTPPDYAPPSWMGQSTGRWEGKTLIVTTTGFNDRGWTREYPRTEDMVVEERYTRIDHNTMDMTLTVTDPGVFEKPWRRTIHFDLAPEEELLEYVCENNQWTIDPQG